MASAVSLLLLKYIADQNKKVGKLYDELCIELAKCGLHFDQLPKDDLFNFEKYPVAAKKAKSIVEKFRKRLMELVTSSIGGAVVLAYKQMDSEFGKFTRLSDKALDEQRKGVSAAFLDYRMKPAKGMSLSDRVWNYTSQTKAEFELGLSQVLEDGIRTGESAEEIGRRVRDKLREPDMMYRRYHRKKILKDGTKKDVVEWRRKVVGQDGKVHFVVEDLEKVGSGVYRSSRQNALRMTGTEINMAYNYADIKRYQQEPFVLGYRILLSPTNHTCKDGDKIISPFHDMCDELTGDYPKWFLWTGWHPRCRCYLESILCSKEEMRRIMKLPKDQYEKYQSPNLIKEMPQCYNDYMEANADRVARSVEAGTQPYWIADNYVDGDPSQGFRSQSELAPVEPAKKNTILERAAKRHEERTSAEIADIQKRWDERRKQLEAENGLEKDVWAAIDGRGGTMGAMKNVFEKYDAKVWEHTMLDSESGGYVVTEKSRIEKGKINNQERQKYQKELSMCKRLASHGHSVEYLNDGEHEDGSYDIRLDGIRADLKKTKSANHIKDYAKHATQEQGAEIVVFEFVRITDKHIDELGKLSRKGIHGYYYETDGTQLFEF